MNDEYEMPSNAETYLFDGDDDGFMDTGERIMALDDALAIDIILDDITQDLSSDLRVLGPRVNYVTMFKRRCESIGRDDDLYDEDHIREDLSKVSATIEDGLNKRFLVRLGTDTDYTTPEERLDDMETLYEFLFIRQSENIVDYMKHMLNANKANFVSTYKKVMANDDSSKDIFLMQSKKRFKKEEDAIITHFINEILTDIKDSTNSAYDLFRTIADLDMYEEFNNRMSEMIINYGDKLVIDDDIRAAKAYMAPLDDQATFAEIRNAVLMDYVESCELSED